MKVTVFGGAEEIGGNQILLEGRKTKILLDFGRSFARESLYFSEPYLAPRKMEQLISLGLLPTVDRLYQQDMEEPPISGVLISHPHLDHMDYVRYLRQDIPIYVGEGTWKIIVAREIVSKRNEPKLVEFMNTSTHLHRCFYCMRSVIFPFRTGKRLDIGEFEVEPVHVDHSVPASYGFVIDGPDGRVAYTGDLRFHGHRGDLSEDFLKKAEGADFLIMEGTNVTDFKPSSEREVREKTEELVKKTRALVLASFSTIDVDRMRTFFEVSISSGRMFVISMKQAALMEFLRPEIEKKLIDFPFTLGDPNVKIYCRKKEIHYTWEKKLMEQFETIDCSWVSQHQKEIVLFSTYYDMLEVLDVDPAPGSIFIYSESEPWDEEGEIEFGKLENWLETLGLPLFHVHASGHAGPVELKGIVERVNPKKVIVVHSERPKLLRKFIGIGEFVCPKRGIPIELS